jgi:hypothetical protein
VVGKTFPALVGIPKSSGMAGGVGGRTNVGSSQGMDERDVGKNVARPGAQVAMKVPACLGAVGGAGRKLGVSPFSARGEAQAAHELTQNFRRLVMAALHETAELVAAQGVREVVDLDDVAAGGERTHSHADGARVLK